MKTLVLAIAATAMLGACRKPHRDTVPSPELRVTFGSLNLFAFEAFWNQNTISRDSLAVLPYIGFRLAEKHLPKSVNDIDNNKLTFVFDAFTNGDREHYDTRQNIIFNLEQKFVNSQVDIEASGFIPIKLSIKPNPGNDTLEFSPIGDHIRIDYTSQYADVKTRDSLYVKP